jgi:hypothetical protein
MTVCMLHSMSPISLSSINSNLNDLNAVTLVLAIMLLLSLFLSYEFHVSPLMQYTSLYI